MITNIFMNTSVSAALFGMMAFLVEQTYDLFIIEDDMVPLGPGRGTNFYLITVCVVIAIALIAVAIGWLAKRRKLAKRLLQLRKKSGNSSEKLPITIKAIKEEINNEEANLAATFI